MFDIGFSELVVIAIVALLVIGPERLPKVARTAGHLFGRLQRYVNDVKADISREMELDELKKLQADVQDAARSIERSVSTEISETQSELNKLADTDVPSPGAAPVAEPESAPKAQAAQLALELDSTPPGPRKTD
jgi:sec-independent protein translocase protein TatB